MTAITVGMYFGRWLAGEIFDWIDSYQVALWNGFGWNLFNLMLVAIILIGAILTKFEDNEIQLT